MHLQPVILLRHKFSLLEIGCIKISQLGRFFFLFLKLAYKSISLRLMSIPFKETNLGACQQDTQDMKSVFAFCILLHLFLVSFP